MTLLNSKNALTALKDNSKGIDFNQLESTFFSDSLNFDELESGTYALHNYITSKKDYLLQEYENKFKINSSIMKKELYYKIERVESNY